jgi:hypothetical protein
MSSAHFGGAVHAGASPSFSAAPRSFAPPSRSLFQSPSPHYQSFPAGQSGHWPSAGQGRRPGDGKPGVGYRGRYPYFYASYTSLIPYGYGFPLAYGLPYGGDQDDASGYPAGQQADYGNQPMSDYAPEAPGTQIAANAPPGFRPDYQGQVEFAPVHVQPATTLIFKDGRPPVQVHNYALTASTLYALDGDSRHEISLSLLNVPATVEANHKAGVDFALPVTH